jgi:molecular chaperone DnaJ
MAPVNHELRGDRYESCDSPTVYRSANMRNPTRSAAGKPRERASRVKVGKTSPESEGFFSKVKEMFGG